MYKEVTAAVLSGINSFTVTVEADIGNGMPVFDLVGFLSSEVREARERIRSAAANSGYPLPAKRITVNVSPADKRKHGTGLDLAIAVAVIAAGVEELCDTAEYLIVGELGLNGDVRPINGVLSMVIAAREAKKSVCIVPYENYREALLVPDMRIVPVKSLVETIGYLKGGGAELSVSAECAEKGCAGEARAVAVSGGDASCAHNACIKNEPPSLRDSETPDFAYINGQKLLRRACEVAVAGRHNLLMVGPPGAGKTMLARCIPTILPPMSMEERLEVSKIYSACGLFGERDALISRRPFRSPHHTISSAGLCGGGTVPHPGEISLAHAGVLFLDELTEFNRSTIEILRQPLEEKQIRISRANGDCEFPADFMLVAAMNPCPCGNYPDPNRCSCTTAQLRSYQGRLSQPLLDRIDICVEAPRVGYDELTGREKNETSAEIRDRIEAVQERQRERFAGESYSYNSEIPPSRIADYCALGEREGRYATELYERMRLTARTYHKLLRVARTIADMEGAENISIPHLSEAICYRGIESAYKEAAL